MGMFAAEPPALLKALADRATAGAVSNLWAYYCKSAPIAGDTILRYELNDRIRPYCLLGVSSEWGYDDTGGTVGRVDSRPGERGCDGCCG